MSDITMCSNRTCPVRMACHRYTADACPYRQSVSSFEPKLEDHGKGLTLRCEYYARPVYSDQAVFIPQYLTTGKNPKTSPVPGLYTSIKTILESVITQIQVRHWTPSGQGVPATEVKNMREWSDAVEAELRAAYPSDTPTVGPDQGLTVGRFSWYLNPKS